MQRKSPRLDEKEKAAATFDMQATVHGAAPTPGGGGALCHSTKHTKVEGRFLVLRSFSLERQESKQKISRNGLFLSVAMPAFLVERQKSFICA